jgi:transcriptional regulator with XRE-family HTH domain
MLKLDDFPIRLRKYREEQGLHQGQLAKMANVTQGQISHYELGKAFPNLESTIRIANAMGVTVASLIGETDARPAPPRPPRKEEMALFILEALGISEIKVDQVRYILGEVPKY